MPTNRNRQPLQPANQGAHILDEVSRTYRRFISMTQRQADTCALYVALSHAHDALHVMAALHFKSAVRRCGKTTALELSSTLVPSPVVESDATEASVIRLLDEGPHTLLLDELDSGGERGERLRSLLNNSYTRSLAHVSRTIRLEVRRFETFGPKFIAYIGDLHSTLMDRGIKLRLHRKSKQEIIESLDRRALEYGAFNPLRDRLAAWGRDVVEQLSATMTRNDTEMPLSLHDRARDNWLPLFALAELAGDSWPRRVREAAIAIEADFEDEEEPNVLTIQAIQHFCAALSRETTRIASAAILSGMKRVVASGEVEGIEADVTPQRLGRILRNFGVRPIHWRQGATTHRGYERRALEGLFARYGTGESLQKPTQTALSSNTKPKKSVRRTIRPRSSPRRSPIQQITKPHRHARSPARA